MGQVNLTIQQLLAPVLALLANVIRTKTVSYLGTKYAGMSVQFLLPRLSNGAKIISQMRRLDEGITHNGSEMLPTLRVEDLNKSPP